MYNFAPWHFVFSRALHSRSGCFLRQSGTRNRCPDATTFSCMHFFIGVPGTLEVCWASFPLVAPCMLLELGRAPCACWSFCTVSDASRYLRLVPTHLHEDSPWRSYLTTVYGERLVLPANDSIEVDVMARLQFLYTSGLPVARCTAGRGTRESPICERRACVEWYPSGKDQAQRQAVRGVEPYYVRRNSSALEILAFRWYWKDPSFVPSNTWIEVFRWKAAGEGERKYGFWYVPAAGSGIWLHTGVSTSHADKQAVVQKLAAEYRKRFGALPSARLVRYEPLAAGDLPLAYIARRLGYDTVQTVHLPSWTTEVLACDANSLYERDVDCDGASLSRGGLGMSYANVSRACLLQPAPPSREQAAWGNACGEAELRRGQHAETACGCERVAGFLNCGPQHVHTALGGAAACTRITHGAAKRVPVCTRLSLVQQQLHARLHEAMHAPSPPPPPPPPRRGRLSSASLRVPHVEPLSTVHTTASALATSTARSPHKQSLGTSFGRALSRASRSSAARWSEATTRCTDAPPMVASQPVAAVSGVAKAWASSGWCQCGAQCPALSPPPPMPSTVISSATISSATTSRVATSSTATAMPTFSTATVSASISTSTSPPDVASHEASAALLAATPVVIIAAQPSCFRRTRAVARAAGLGGPLTHLPATFVSSRDVLTKCCPGGYCGKGSRLKPAARAVMDGGMQAHRAAWTHVAKSAPPSHGSHAAPNARTARYTCYAAMRDISLSRSQCASTRECLRVRQVGYRASCSKTTFVCSARRMMWRTRSRCAHAEAAISPIWARASRCSSRTLTTSRRTLPVGCYSRPMRSNGATATSRTVCQRRIRERSSATRAAISRSDLPH